MHTICSVCNQRITHRYRRYPNELDSDPSADSSEAETTDGGAPSSPVSDTLENLHTIPAGIPLSSLEELPEDDEGDTDWKPVHNSERLSPVQRVEDVLKYMKAKHYRLSLQTFLDILTGDSGQSSEYIKHTTGIFFADEQSSLKIIRQLFERGGKLKKSSYRDWVLERGREIYVREFSQLTEAASDGKHYGDALSLRLSAKDMSMERAASFRILELQELYNRALPNFQDLLCAVVGKEGKSSDSKKRNPIIGRTFATSMLLNLRSRRVSYHATIIGLVMWHNNASKRLIQLFNQCGLSISLPSLGVAIASLSKDSTRLAQIEANKPSNVPIFPYDNFNWVGKAWEKSASHGNLTHDQVSALLLIAFLYEGSEPQKITQLSRFDETAGMRHKLPRHQALAEILPSQDDQKVFRHHSSLHVAHILINSIHTFAPFRSKLQDFFDPDALPPHKTTKFYLPTFDQEQGSTRGNMLVLEHYFSKVLQIPHEEFSQRAFFPLGDRLTTARDRAAQDQRAVDRSPDSFYHLSAYKVLSGLMHICMNQIHNIGKNCWGGDSASTDPVSLSCIIKELPNREDINIRKIDFYAWLRFFDTILQALVITAFMVKCGVDSIDKLKDIHFTIDKFTSLCDQIVCEFLLPSADRLEEEGVKKIPGQTLNSHAVLLMHDLMTVREMRHGIKYGHPKRIERMLKYWMPMYYAGGGYNYSNELMELLHNLIHDWPKDSAKVLSAAMLVNNSGEPDGFTEADLDVEHLNRSIKGHIAGPNVTPRYLENIVPAIGPVSELHNQLLSDIGINVDDTHHAHVNQKEDILNLVKYFQYHKFFQFHHDHSSEHAVIDLYRVGIQRLAGVDGAHARHLERHKLRFRARHGGSNDNQLFEELAQYKPNSTRDELQEESPTFILDEQPMAFNHQDEYDSD
ncbi:hypothetical protein VKT23_001318 [Stygiomarasmius scandens]|uniref:DUF6589 domain-containing protein n=1 Tax=Marasmiellus scandens TaxID=2682957 RepID=A0ABR1K6Q8_9AGAR